MEYYILQQDHLAVVSDLTETSILGIIEGDTKIPEIEDDTVLGDIVVFKIVTDGTPNAQWFSGRLCSVDPMIDPIDVTNIDNIFFHRFPTTTYLYVTHEGSLDHLGTVLDNIEETHEYDFIYPPVLTFPDGLPNTLNQKISIDMWLATAGTSEDDVLQVDNAKVHRSYSYNYVNALLDFSNLPDYKEDE